MRGTEGGKKSGKSDGSAKECQSMIEGPDTALQATKTRGTKHLRLRTWHFRAAGIAWMQLRKPAKGYRRATALITRSANRHQHEAGRNLIEHRRLRLGEGPEEVLLQALVCRKVARGSRQFQPQAFDQKTHRQGSSEASPRRCGHKLRCPRAPARMWRPKFPGSNGPPNEHDFRVCPAMSINISHLY